jgi:hypothetical protein
VSSSPMVNAPSVITAASLTLATAAPASQREKIPAPTPSGCRGFPLKSNLRRERCPALPAVASRPRMPRRSPVARPPAGRVTYGIGRHSMEQAAAASVVVRHGRSSAWPRSSVRSANGEILTIVTIS